MRLANRSYESVSRRPSVGQKNLKPKARPQRGPGRPAARWGLGGGEGCPRCLHVPDRGRDGRPQGRDTKAQQGPRRRRRQERNPPSVQVSQAVWPPANLLPRPEPGLARASAPQAQGGAPGGTPWRAARGGRGGGIPRRRPPEGAGPRRTRPSRQAARRPAVPGPHPGASPLRGALLSRRSRSSAPPRPDTHVGAEEGGAAGLGGEGRSDCPEMEAAPLPRPADPRGRGGARSLWGRGRRRSSSPAPPSSSLINNFCSTQKSSFPARSQCSPYSPPG